MGLLLGADADSCELALAHGLLLPYHVKAFLGLFLSFTKLLLVQQTNLLHSSSMPNLGNLGHLGSSGILNEHVVLLTALV